MPDVLSEPEAELLDAMAAILEHGATAPFLANALVHHDEAHFPDRWTPDLRGVRTALRRMLRHAELFELDVSLEDFRGGADAVDSDDTVAFLEIEGRIAHFSVQGVAKPSRMVATVGLEVARAWGTWTGLDASVRDGYRGADEAERELVGDTACSMIMIALGLGIIALNGSAQLLKSESVAGAFVVGSWRQSQVGGLPPPLCAFLLATQLVVRGVEGSDLVEVLGAVGSDHRATLNREVTRLRPLASELAERLGLPPRDAWPAPKAVDTDPLPDDDTAMAELAARESEFREELAAPNRGTVVFRVRKRKTMAFAVLGTIAGVAGAAVSSPFGALVSLAFLVGGIGGDTVEVDASTNITANGTGRTTFRPVATGDFDDNEDVLGKMSVGTVDTDGAYVVGPGSTAIDFYSNG
ncbi:MAG: hypothetical protein AAF721_14655, partial [Myxococcota bacterium]